MPLINFMKTIIKTNHLTVRYGQSDVIQNVSISIESGDFIGLVGPNGAGKSTFMKALLGLLPIAQGSITLFGQKQQAFSHWEKIGYLPQKFSHQNPLFPASVEEVILLGLLAGKKIPKIITSSDSERLQEVLYILGIRHLRRKMYSELSGGQQQRVMLARSLISRPELLIFDEPSTALDPEARESFFQLIQKLNKEKGIAIILITHDTGYVGKYANKLLYLDKEVVYFGNFSNFCGSKKMSSYFGTYDQHIICHQHD